MDCLIVIDDVSCIADNCKKFAEFLTVCRKYRYDCIYVFNIIMLKNQICKNILSQTNIFNIFPSSVPYNTVAKLFQITADKQQNNMFLLVQWLNRVFTGLANTDERYCLRIDCSGINKNGPGRYKTQPDGPEKQV